MTAPMQPDAPTSPFRRPFVMRPTERRMLDTLPPIPVRPQPAPPPQRPPNRQVELWVAEEMNRLPWFTIDELVERVGLPHLPAWHPDNCNTPVAVAGTAELTMPCTLRPGHPRACQVWDIDGTLTAESPAAALPTPPRPSPRPRVQKIEVTRPEPEAAALPRAVESEEAS